MSSYGLVAFEALHVVALPPKKAQSAQNINFRFGLLVFARSVRLAHLSWVGLDSHDFGDGLPPSSGLRLQAQ